MVIATFIGYIRKLGGFVWPISILSLDIHSISKFQAGVSKSKILVQDFRV